MGLAGIQPFGLTRSGMLNAHPKQICVAQFATRRKIITQELVDIFTPMLIFGDFPPDRFVVDLLNFFRYLA